jgi:hypothetical protein
LLFSFRIRTFGPVIPIPEPISGAVAVSGFRPHLVVGRRVTPINCPYRAWRRVWKWIPSISTTRMIRETTVPAEAAPVNGIEYLLQISDAIVARRIRP